MRFRSRTVHETRDIERPGGVRVPHANPQSLARRMRFDRVDATPHHPELAARDRPLDFAVNTGRDTMTMCIPERPDVTKEAPTLGERPVAPERGRDATQL